MGLGLLAELWPSHPHGSGDGWAPARCSPGWASSGFLLEGVLPLGLARRAGAGWAWYSLARVITQYLSVWAHSTRDSQLAWPQHTWQCRARAERREAQAHECGRGRAWPGLPVAAGLSQPPRSRPAEVLLAPGWAEGWGLGGGGPACVSPYLPAGVRVQGCGGAASASSPRRVGQEAPAAGAMQGGSAPEASGSPPCACPL